MSSQLNASTNLTKLPTQKSTSDSTEYSPIISGIYKNATFSNFSGYPNTPPPPYTEFDTNNAKQTKESAWKCTPQKKAMVKSFTGKQYRSSPYSLTSRGENFKSSNMLEDAIENLRTLSVTEPKTVVSQEIGVKAIVAKLEDFSEKHAGNVGVDFSQQALESTQELIDVLNEEYECPEYGVLPELEGDGSNENCDSKECTWDDAPHSKKF